MSATLEKKARRRMLPTDASVCWLLSATFEKGPREKKLEGADGSVRWQLLAIFEK